MCHQHSLLQCLPLAEVERGNRLLADYQAGNAEVRCWLGDTAERSARPRVDGDALAAALAGYQQHLGADDHAVRQARLLAHPATRVVTVGQQPGLLGGPLYTLYKALTAICLANRMREAGQQAVAVFWIAADDDDRAEIDHVGCWDTGETLQTIRYPQTAGAPGALVGSLPVGEAGEQVLAQLAPLLAGLPHAGEVMALYRETLEASRDFGEWFALILARWLSPLGLVLCDARLPAVRRLAREVLRREITAPLRTTAAVNAQARVMQQAGYHPALTKPAETCNFFLLEAEQRRRVTSQDGRFTAGDATYTRTELLELLASAPERLLPNAVLRPVVQEYLFASAAFVAGPNEMGYWAELPPVFHALEVPMPPVVPRAGATLLPANYARQLRKWGVAPWSLLDDYDGVRFSLLEQEQSEPIRQAFAQGKVTVDRLVAELSAAVAVLDPTLAQSTLATQQRMMNEIERLERKAGKALERRAGERTARLEHMREVLFPHHGLQERALGAPAILARYGLSCIPALEQLFSEHAGQHLSIAM